MVDGSGKGDGRAAQGEAFPKSCRLRTQAEFDRVHRGELYAADQVLVVRGCPNGHRPTRLGLSIGRRVGNAVVRNRWKRRIREVFRRRRSEFPPGWDLVVRPRRGAQCDYHAIDRSLVPLARRIARRWERIGTPGGEPSP